MKDANTDTIEKSHQRETNITTKYEHINKGISISRRITAKAVTIGVV